MDNIRFVLVVTFGMLIFMLWQAWEQDYNPKPEVATISTPEVAKNKEDLPVTAQSSVTTESGTQKSVTSSESISSISKTIKIKSDVGK